MTKIVASEIVLESEKSWSLGQVSGGPGFSAIGGFYDYAASDNDFSPSVTHGVANLSYAAHFFVVLGAVAVDDISITVTGTSITDGGVRDATPDTEIITIPNGATVGSYFETTKKWLGQVTIETTAGTPKTCNYGYCKYWDNNNTNFRLVGVNVTWIGGKADSTPNVILRHHKSSGWTFNVGATPTPPSPVVDMAADHVTEIQTASGKHGAWKRDNLNDFITGNNGEGVIIEVVSSAGAGKSFEDGTFLLRIAQA